LISLSLLGRALILAALGLAAAGAVTGFAAGRSGSDKGLLWTRRLATAFGACLVGANVVMVYALLVRDYTVAYVDQVGSDLIPDWLAVVSLWSSLEGSILFWGAILGIFTLAFALTTARRPEHRDLVPYTLATILAVGVFFTLLIAAPADPFYEVVPRPDAYHTGPNPLLQNHLLMIVHPPSLYGGYVGMTIPFSMGVAALLKGRLGAGWMRPIRSWMLVPWGFLTAGIVLGGWWAYEVLGWGGYWAWDPVENASFLPWLTATGFLHAAMLMERRGLLKAWTLVLLLGTFALTILGTFMTRSGVFNSVHAFSAGPIGPAFLIFLAIILVGSVLLLGTRAHLLEPDGSFRSPVSRDAAFVVNNLLFASFTFTVLVGTTFPLIKEAMTGEKLTVGEPYFNSMAAPTGVAIVLLMALGPALPWGRALGSEVLRILALPVAGGLVLTGIGLGLGVRDGWTTVTLLVVGMAVMVSLRDMATPILALRRRGELGLGQAAVRAFRRGRRRYGGQTVHLGVALMVAAIAVSANYKVSVEAVVDRGELLDVGDYQVRFDGKNVTTEEHRVQVGAVFTVFQDGVELGKLEPKMNRYRGQSQPIGTPAVMTRFHEDLYLSAMQIDDAGQFAGLRAFVNPMLYWIWIAAGIMLLGCVIAVWPSGRRRGSAGATEEAS
jgi:cytochrome c-type biogenesis protein CcmF